MSHLYITKYIKPRKNMVVELRDGIRYVIDSKALFSIKHRRNHIFLTRMVDKQPVFVEIEEIIESILKKGIIGYLDRI